MGNLVLIGKDMNDFEIYLDPETYIAYRMDDYGIIDVADDIEMNVMYL